MPVFHRHFFLSVIAASLPLLAASIASAGAPLRPFGARGQVVIEDLVAIRTSGVGYLRVLSPASSKFGTIAPPAFSGLVGYDRSEFVDYQSSLRTTTVNTITVAPSLDAFVADRTSLGLTAGFGHGWGQRGLTASERATSYTFGIAPRVGYVIPLEAGFSLWPRVGMGFTLSFTETVDVTPGRPSWCISATRGVRWSGGVDLGVIFRPTRHFFFSATPELSVDYSSSGDSVGRTMIYRVQGTRVGFAGTVGFGVLLGT